MLSGKEGTRAGRLNVVKTREAIVAIRRVQGGLDLTVTVVRHRRCLQASHRSLFGRNGRPRRIGFACRDSFDSGEAPVRINLPNARAKETPLQIFEPDPQSKNGGRSHSGSCSGLRSVDAARVSPIGFAPGSPGSGWLLGADTLRSVVGAMGEFRP